MNKPLTAYARIGLVHHMLYPETLTDPVRHVETLAALAGRDDIEAIDCCLPFGAEYRAQIAPLLVRSGKDIAGCVHLSLMHQVKPASSDPFAVASCREVYADQIECARRMGATGFVFVSGRAGDNDTEESAKETFAAFCSWFCGELASYGITALLEPFDTDIDKKFLYGPTAMCVDLIRSLEPETANFRINLDFAHLPLMGEPFDTAVATVQPVLGRVHLGNCVLRDRSSSWYGDLHPPVGLDGGEIDTPQLTEQLGLLLEAGYLSRDRRGTLVMEMRPFPGMTAKATVTDQFDRLKTAWAAV